MIFTFSFRAHDTAGRDAEKKFSPSLSAMMTGRVIGYLKIVYFFRVRLRNSADCTRRVICFTKILRVEMLTCCLFKNCHRWEKEVLNSPREVDCAKPKQIAFPTHHD